MSGGMLRQEEQILAILDWILFLGSMPMSKKMLLICLAFSHNAPVQAMKHR